MKSFWHTLSKNEKPLYIYGTGNGADKIIDTLTRLGIEISGIFASDGFVRDRTFRGFKVQSYSDVRAAWGDDISVICAFGTTLASVIEFLRILDERHELYVPEVPLFCDDLAAELFDDSYLEAHTGELSEAYGLMCDEQSRLLFEDMIAHRLTGRLSRLSRVEAVSDSITSLLPVKQIERVIDGGAFKGDTALLFDQLFPALTHLAAIEPDTRSFKKLSELRETVLSLIPISGMLDSSNGERTFVSSASRGSSPDAAVSGSPKRSRDISVSAYTVDRVVTELLCGRVDFIKLDTEGYEYPALLGAINTLSTRPALSVSLYHRTGDIFALPLFLRQFYPDGKFYLRRPECIPEWDLTLYVVP